MATPRAEQLLRSSKSLGHRTQWLRSHGDRERLQADRARPKAWPRFCDLVARMAQGAPEARQLRSVCPQAHCFVLPHPDARQEMLSLTPDTKAECHLKNCSDPRIQGFIWVPLGPLCVWVREGKGEDPGTVGQRHFPTGQEHREPRPPTSGSCESSSGASQGFLTHAPIMCRSLLRNPVTGRTLGTGSSNCVRS